MATIGGQPLSVHTYEPITVKIPHPDGHTTLVISGGPRVICRYEYAKDGNFLGSDIINFAQSLDVEQTGELCEMLSSLDDIPFKLKEAGIGEQPNPFNTNDQDAACGT